MSSNGKTRAAGYLTFTLHAHLPYVVNHGTWPHGMEWLLEAAAETYLPLLRVMERLERDGLALHCNLNISPVLMEQLAHPVFLAEFPNYVTRKIVSAKEDEAYFTQSGEPHYAETARFWRDFFTLTLEHFHRLQGGIVQEFARLHRAGALELLTCGATHGYNPLLGTDESVRAQIRVAMETHKRHTGEYPKGIWAPECGYRPAGYWEYPVAMADGVPTPAGFERIGTEQAISESGLKFFFVDTHLVEDADVTPGPYELRGGARLTARTEPGSGRSLYKPYLVDGPYDKRFATAVFPRDPQTGVQVWSGDAGYPGDGNYVDFHKKRWPGGHRYWRVTGPRVEMADKEAYFPQEALARTQSHARHFVQLVRDALRSRMSEEAPPILCSPFDAELFGHWWFEGPMWLEAVARMLHEAPEGLELTSCSAYLEKFPAQEFLAMREGSWGAEGSNQVWLNPETSWTYAHLYPAELYTREVCTAGVWRESALGTRIVQQMCRELLLLESSDWQFLMTTGAARDYAELRFLTHNDQFKELQQIWQAYAADGSLNEHLSTRLAAIETRDGIFPEIDPGYWVAGATAAR